MKFTGIQLFSSQHFQHTMQLNGSFHPQQLAISAHHFLLAQVISYAIFQRFAVGE
jgi:hypothetical protein